MDASASVGPSPNTNQSWRCHDPVSLRPLWKENRSMRSLKLLLLALICAASARAEVDKKAERNWKGKCASCHGADGKGQTDQGKKMKVDDMTAASWQKGDAVMEGYKDKLDGAQIDGLVAYVRTLK